jgi:electron transfer flavoprotein alpha subunit
MGDSGKPVWVIAEQSGGELLEVSLQLVGHARVLADELKAPVGAVLLGYGISELPKTLIHSGASMVFLGDDRTFENYQPEIFTETIVSLAKEYLPQIILLGATFMGRELAPLVAARLGTGLTAHCTNLALNKDQILDQRIPAYGGLMTILCPERRPQMATAARGVFGTPPLNSDRSGEVIPISPPAGVDPRVQTLEIVEEKITDIEIDSAPLVVAGGAGAETLEGWNEIKALAKALNAALGSTRPAVDRGWIDITSMIGQSGKIISPKFYIGIGLSGEQQHMVGIVDAKVMVAINDDPKSPVFDQVDYGIVEDCREFVPLLIEKVKQKIKDKHL